jgi:glycosyltransferase A (GT-A) superfamily protein (DUF2064 family)
MVAQQVLVAVAVAKLLNLFNAINLIKAAHFHQTCILYFSTGNNSSKSFSSKKKKTIAVQKLLFKKTLLEIRKTKISFLLSDGINKDASFADKIDCAINEAFLKGFKKIILVGDDTPQLSANQLLKAAQSLENNKLSVGPSTDGGAYLISFTQQHFKDGILKGLAWQTNQFYENLLLNISNQKLAFTRLAAFSDLNTEADLQQFLKLKPFLKFTQVLYSLCIHQKIQTYFSILIESGYQIAFQGRGPPLAA